MVKRTLLIILVAFLLPTIGVLADVSGALYSATVRAVNTSYTAQRVAVPFTLSTDALIDGFYINSDVNNVSIQDSIGNDMTFMPAPPGDDEFVLYIPQISQNSSVNYTLYSGGPDMTPSIAYFPASTGMTTTDDASMEPGDDFEIIIDGLINTAAGADKYLVSKDGTLSLYVSGDEEITCNIITNPVAPVIEGYTGGYDTSDETDHTVNLPAETEDGHLLLIFLTSDATPSITFPAGWTELYATSNTAVKSGAWYKEASGEGASINVTTGGAEKASYISYAISSWSDIECGSAATGTDDNPDPPSLTASWGTLPNLWFAAEGNDDRYGVSSYPTNYSDGLNYYQSGNTATAATGAAHRYVTTDTENPGAFTISAADHWVANTVVIKPGYPEFIVTAADIESGEHEVKVEADGTDLNLYVDDVLEDTVALAGASIIDTVSDWEYCLNNSVTYLNSLETYVSSVLVQQIEWEYDETTFTDGSGSGNDATPTFRTTSTDADVSASLLNFGVIAEAEATGYDDSDTVPMITVSPDEPPQAYGTMDVTFPGATVINNLLDAGRFPRELFWYPLLFGLSAAIGMFAYHVTRSVMMQAMISGTGIAISTLGILQADFWVLIPFVIISIALITQRKTVSL